MSACVGLNYEVVTPFIDDDDDTSEEEIETDIRASCKTRINTDRISYCAETKIQSLSSRCEERVPVPQWNY